MRLVVLVAAAIATAVPAVAFADDPPALIDGTPQLNGTTLDVNVWVAFGYGKQLVNDHAWNPSYPFVRPSQNAKTDTDVVLRVDAGSCAATGEVSLVGSVPGHWTTFERVVGDTGWIWHVSLDVSTCLTASATRNVVTLHCTGQGDVNVNCGTEAIAGALYAELDVQALNRPANEKCTLDLDADGDRECDHAVVGTASAGVTANPAIRFTAADNANRWNYSPAGGCLDADYAAGTCRATCLHSSRNGVDTVVGISWTGATWISGATLTVQNSCSGVYAGPAAQRGPARPAALPTRLLRSKPAKLR